MDTEQLSYGHQFLAEVVAILELQGTRKMDELAERLEEIADEIAAELDKGNQEQDED